MQTTLKQLNRVIATTRAVIKRDAFDAGALYNLRRYLIDTTRERNALVRHVEDEVLALQTVVAQTQARENLHHEINKRHRLIQHIEQHQWQGRVPVWVQGMDCDCCEYGACAVVGATNWREYRDWQNDRFDGIDGTESHRLLTWSEYRDLADKSFSRDLAAEAFEDGHPHVVHPRGMTG